MNHVIITMHEYTMRCIRNQLIFIGKTHIIKFAHKVYTDITNRTIAKGFHEQFRKQICSNI